MISSLDVLLAPLAASTFFAEYYEKKHLHLRTQCGPRGDLLSQDELWRALLEAPTIPEEVVCFPEQIGVDRTELLSNGTVLKEYVDAGHPLVWNRARGISASIDALSALLAEAFGGHVWPNVYATGSAGTPFDMHFDAHEVFAIQCAGQKTWEISRVRVDRPIEAVEMASTIRHVLQARREEAEANVLDTFTVCPGDLVYVPRGQFHNACSYNGRSLHVTFGIELPTGFDLAKRMIMEILGDSAMREYPHPQAIDPDGQRARAWSFDVAELIAQRCSPDAIATIQEEMHRAWVKKSANR